MDFLGMCRISVVRMMCGSSVYILGVDIRGS